MFSLMKDVSTWLVWGYGNFPPNAFLLCQDAPDYLLPPRMKNISGGLLRNRWCVLLFADWQTANRNVLASPNVIDFKLVETGVRLSKKLAASNIGKSHDKRTAATEDLCDSYDGWPGACGGSSSSTSGEFRWRVRGKRPKRMPPKQGSPRPLTPPAREDERG